MLPWASHGLSPGPRHRGLLRAGRAHDVTAGWGLCLPLRVCSTGRSVAPWPRWAAHRYGQPATLPALFPLSAELQGRAGADRSAQPRQHGECAPWPTPGSSAGQGEPCPFTSSPTSSPSPWQLPTPLSPRSASPDPHGFTSFLCPVPARPGCPPATACLPLLPVAMVFSSASPSAS